MIQTIAAIPAEGAPLCYVCGERKPSAMTGGLLIEFVAPDGAVDGERILLCRKCGVVYGPRVEEIAKRAEQQAAKE